MRLIAFFFYATLARAQPFQLEKTIPLPGVEGRIDGEGFLEAFAQKSANEYQSLGKVATAAGAGTALFVPDLNRIFLAVPHRGNQGAEVRVFTVE